MNAREESPHIPGWVKVTAALILLAGLLLGGILAAPGVHPVQALDAFPQVSAPQGATSTGINGTLASFTAMIPEVFPIYLPLVTK
jgi:hypothetical protein